MPGDRPESDTRKPVAAGASPAALLLSLAGVTVAVGSVEICSEVSLEVDAGQVAGIIGPNGSGKTMLLRAVYRALRPRLGRVVVGADDLWDLRPPEAARRIAVVVQEPRSDFEFTVQEVVAMGRSPHQSAFARESADDRYRVNEALYSREHCGTGATVVQHAVRGEKSKGRRSHARSCRKRGSCFSMSPPTTWTSDTSLKFSNSSAAWA